jgi:hypothetical protein
MALLAWPENRRALEMCHALVLERFCQGHEP